MEILKIRLDQQAVDKQSRKSISLKQVGVSWSKNIKGVE